MKNLIALAFLVLASACGAPQTERIEPSGVLEVRDGWASPTPGGVDVSAGYLTIANGTDADDRLIAASSPRAASVEIHEMEMDGAVMRMRPVEALVIPAGGEVTLGQGGAHLMFIGVTQPFTAGEEIALQLTFESAGVVDTTLPVRTGP
jgi:copper(I)-binding protein